MPALDKFVHLHVHTEYSVLDGLGTVKDYVGKAVEIGQPALAVTDHGGVWGAPEFYHAARKAGIEPIIGQEFYLVQDVDYRPGRGEKQPERFHVTMLARGEQGYRTLAELSTEAHKHFYYKPVVDRRLLEALGDATDHLTVLSGCAASRLSEFIRAEQMGEAAEELMWWRETFPHFYIEVMHHDTDFDLRLNEGLLELADAYGVPWVITNDPHYVVADDCDHHDALLAIQTASDIDDPNRFKFDGNGYFLKSRQEMRRTFLRHYDEVTWKQGAANTLKIAEECYTRIPGWEQRTWQIPRLPGVDDAYAELKKLVVRALKRRGLWNKPEYRRRAVHELKVIKQTGISDFLLITRESIIWAREQGIPVGPGRGSVCGSLVAWLIDLHKMDPIRYNLLFERFLNPERPRMPDIDTDFGQARRGELFDHVVELYGEENVVHVATYQRMKVKKAFQSLARAYGIGFAERNRLSAKIIEDKETNDYILPEEITGNPRYSGLVDQLDRLNGTKVAFSTHPAGVIIASPEAHIRSQVPEMRISKDKFTGQFDLEAVEEMGLMKQDFLGLRTLDTIADCLDLIEQRTGERLDPDSWIPDEEPDDRKVYAMLAKGRTSGVFQMEGPTNQRGCRDVKPKNFEDIVSITSLYRTGAISAGFPAIFNANRQNSQDEIPYVHPSLEPILRDTWGCVLYQEQVMEMGRSLAGFDMLQVDDIKESIKHKKSDLLKSMKRPFVTGCMRTVGMSKTQALACWKMIEGYSGYGYNRSHAVAYSFTTYQTARLKKLYPVEFFCALLRTVEDKDKRDVYMREATDQGIKILKPDINLSMEKAVPEGNDIRLGLSDFSGIGEKQAVKIVAGRPEEGYSDVAQVEAAVRNIGVMRILSEGCALEELGVRGNRTRLEELINWTFDDRMAPFRERYGRDVVLPDGSGDPVCLLGEIFHVSSGETKNGKPYRTWKIRYSITQQFDIRLWSETKKFWDLKEGDIVMVSGEWEDRWQNISVGRPGQVRIIKRQRRPRATSSSTSQELADAS